MVLSRMTALGIFQSDLDQMLEEPFRTEVLKLRRMIDFSTTTDINLRYHLTLDTLIWHYVGGVHENKENP